MLIKAMNPIVILWVLRIAGWNGSPRSCGPRVASLRAARFDVEFGL